MKIKNLILGIAVYLFSGVVYSQEYPSRFSVLLQNNDTTRQLALLTEWSSDNPKDPELFIAWFNYYARKSRKEVIALEKDSKNKESFILTDSAGKTAGFLNPSLMYDPVLLQKGFDHIDQGIALYPTRLDMRFGKVYMYGEAEDFRSFTTEIVKIIEYAQTINYKWLWKEGKPLEDAKEFFLSSLQNYIGTLYNTEDDNLLPLMREIAETVLKYHPDHVESLANTALTYLINGDYDKALPFLLKAEKINPKDIIVLNNIAEIYKRKGDKANRKIYLEKIILHGNEEDAEDARLKLKEL
ncbi:MAG: tetratricopeptide repeat protein [Chitinophagaceae bacterium]|nr:tetratricopeptide repeat protein [Chitinophagaceae bacterium]